MMIVTLMRLYPFYNTYKILNGNYYNIEKYCIKTRSQARSSCIKLPEVHGMRKNLDPM